MASFSGEINPPGNIGEPSTWAITERGSLGQAAADVGKSVESLLTGLGELKGKRDVAETEQKVTQLTSDYAKANGPQLIGEGQPPSATTQGVITKGSALQQANQTGRMSETEYMARLSGVVSDAVAKDPYHADEIRKAVREQLGFSPEQEQYRIASQDQELNRAQQKEAEGRLIGIAADAGIIKYNNDGTLDRDGMVKAGQDVAANKQKAADALMQAQTQALLNKQPLSHEQVIDTQVSTVGQNLDDSYEHVLSGSLSGIPALVDQASKNPGQEGAIRQQIFTALGTARAQWIAHVQDVAIANHLLPEAVEQLQKKYAATFDALEKLSSGPLSALTQLKNTLETWKTQNGINFHESAPLAAAVTDVAPGAVIPLLNNVINNGGDYTTAAEGQVKGWLANNPNTPVMTAGQSASVLGGTGYDLTKDQHPGSQTQTLAGVIGALDHYGDNPHLMTPRDSSAFLNGVTQVSALGVQGQTAEEIENAAAAVQKPGYLAALAAANKDPNNRAAVLNAAGNMRHLLATNIQAQSDRILNPGITMSASIPLRFNANERINQQVNVQPHTVFNPVTGHLELQGVTVTDDRGQEVRLNARDGIRLQSILKNYNGTLASVNGSLDALGNLKDYAPGQLATLSAAQVKQLEASAYGYVNKEGVPPTEMPTWMTGKQSQSENGPQKPKVGQKQNGPSVNYLTNLNGSESSGKTNAKNPRSSATGVDQFIKTTWLSLFKKYMPGEAEALGSDEAILKMRNNKDFSDDITLHYAQENTAYLNKHGIQNVNDAEVAMSHKLGPQGALKVLTSPVSARMADILPPEVIKDNPNLKHLSVGQYYHTLSTQFGG